MNWNNWTYRQKNRFLSIGCLVFMLIVYQFAVRASLDLYTQNKALEERIQSARGAVLHSAELEKNRNKLEGRIAAYSVDSMNHQEQMLEMISNFSHRNGVLIREIPSMTSYREGDVEIRTHKIVLEGAFIPLLKLVYALEQQHKLGRVSSVRFFSKYDHKRKREVLSLVIYLQNIQLNDEQKPV